MYVQICVYIAVYEYEFGYTRTQFCDLQCNSCIYTSASCHNMFKKRLGFQGPVVKPKSPWDGVTTESLGHNETSLPKRSVLASGF